MRDRTAGLTGRRRWLAAFVLGGLAAAALPPVYAVPLLIPAFTGLLWLIDGTSGVRAAAAAGWWFGLGLFVFGIYWIGFSMLVDAAKFAWMIPFAVFGISAVEAAFPALAALVMRFWPGLGPGRVIAFAAAWTAAEWLRGVALSGFPWNLTGTAWTFSDSMMQIASVVGTYGLGLLTVAAAAMPAVLGDPPEPGHAANARVRWGAAAAAAAGLAAVWAFGAARLADAGSAMQPGVRLRIVQPDIAQKDKWRSDMRQANLNRLIRLSDRPGRDTITDVIWPEAAAPYPLSIRPGARLQAAEAAPPGGLLFTGAPRVALRAGGGVKIWNSLYVLDGSGDTLAVYDKHHLVPFGEYVPLRETLRPLGIDKLTPGGLDFSAGPGPRTLLLPGLPPVSPLICYEVIFPGGVVAPGAPRPAWLLNITNDAWFGRSSGPHQHFEAARLRAVEEGLPLVRSANTGISAVIDPYGRVLHRLGLEREGIIDSALPKPLPALTPFARLGNGMTLAVILVAFAVAVMAEALRRAGRRASDRAA